MPYTSLPDGATGETEFEDGNLGFAVDSIRIVARNDFLAANPAAVRGGADRHQRHFGREQADADGEDGSADIDRHVEDWIAAHRAEYDAWLAEAHKAAK